MRGTRLAYVAAALAVLAGCSHSGSDRAGKPNPSGSATTTPFDGGTAGPSGGPALLPTPAPKYVVTTCRTEGLSMRLGTFTDKGNEIYVNLYVKNSRGPACTLSGYGSLALFSEDGSEVPTLTVEEAAPAPATVSLRPGQEAVQRIRWTNKPVADEPKNGACGVASIVLSVRLTAPSVAVDLYTKSAKRPQGIGPVCNHGRLLHTAWAPA
ncbi:MAG: DUF4232 domain-containing protein [Mycobacteriales bacterium]